jgi:hypothetical protein
VASCRLVSLLCGCLLTFLPLAPADSLHCCRHLRCSLYMHNKPCSMYRLCNLHTCCIGRHHWRPCQAGWQPGRLIGRSNAVVTAAAIIIMHMWDMSMQRAFESPPTQLTVNPCSRRDWKCHCCCPAELRKIMLLLLSRLPRYLITCSMTTTDVQHDRTGGQVGLPPNLPSQPTASCPPVDASLEREPGFQQLQARKCCKKMLQEKFWKQRCSC